MYFNYWLTNEVLLSIINRGDTYEKQSYAVVCPTDSVGYELLCRRNRISADGRWRSEVGNDDRKAITIWRFSIWRIKRPQKMCSRMRIWKHLQIWKSFRNRRLLKNDWAWSLQIQPKTRWQRKIRFYLPILRWMKTGKDLHTKWKMRIRKISRRLPIRERKRGNWYMNW